jgi:hypothetical protein
LERSIRWFLGSRLERRWLSLNWLLATCGLVRRVPWWLGRHGSSRQSRVICQTEFPSHGCSGNIFRERLSYPLFRDVPFGIIEILVVFHQGEQIDERVFAFRNLHDPRHLEKV